MGGRENSRLYKSIEFLWAIDFDVSDKGDWVGESEVFAGRRVSIQATHCSLEELDMGIFIYRKT